MPRRVTTITPENVGIEYELAGIASRSGAAAIDIFIQAMAILIIVVVYFALELTLHFNATGLPSAILIILSFLLWWGYYVYFETRWNGQTPGKRLLRLRVVRYGGTPINLSCAAIRGLIRTIDLGIIGIIVMLVTSKNQRLGDFAAGTLVVKERSEWLGDLAQPKAVTMQNYSEAELVMNIELVTAEQFETIKRFLDRAPELQPNIREQLAIKISSPIMKHLGIENNGRIVHSNLLSAIHEKCISERGMR